MTSFKVLFDDLVLEKQTHDDLGEAYGMIVSRTAELVERKTGQYVAPFPPIGQYALRTELGQNWLVRSGSDPGKQIMGIVSLIPNGGGGDWSDVAFPGEYYWISSLFVSPGWKNQNLGRIILDRVKSKARTDGMGSLWLDCYLDSGFLQPYDLRNGFRTVSSQTFTYGSRSFGAALMRHDLDREGD